MNRGTCSAHSDRTGRSNPSTKTMMANPAPDPAAPVDVALLDWNGSLHVCSSSGNGLHPQTKGSDAARAVAAYARGGGVCGLGRLIGDWSLVVEDQARSQVVLASDYMGNRPLYYALSNDVVYWSTSDRAIARHIRANEPDENFIAAFLRFGGLPGHTPYKKVKSVPPGHAVVIDRDISIVPFWKMPIRDDIARRDARANHDEFVALLEEAVAARMRGPGPVSVELSGGLDSTAVAAMAVRLRRQEQSNDADITALSYVFPGSADTPYIETATALLKLRTVRISTTSAPLLGSCEPTDLLPTPSGPVHRAAAEAARRLGAHVLMTGQLGDLVCGNVIDDSMQVRPDLLRGRLWQAFTAASAWSRATGKPLLRILARAIRGPRLDDETITGATAADHLVHRDLLRAQSCPSAAELFSADWLLVPMEIQERVLLLTVMRELRVLQAPSAFADIAYTHPFSHRPLVEYLTNVPARALCGPGQPRALMRAALAHVLPKEILQRRSKGFFSSEVLAALQSWARVLGPARSWQSVRRGWICAYRLARSLEALACGVCPTTTSLRNAILVESWLREEGSQSNNWSGPAVDSQPVRWRSLSN